MDYTSLFQTIFVFLVLIGVGFFGARRGVFGPAFSKAASFLILNIFLLASVVNAICSNTGLVSKGELGHILLIISLSLTLCYAIAWASFKLIGRRFDDPGPAELSVAVLNTLLFGLPVVQEAYGGAAVMYTGLSSVAFYVLLYTYGTWRLSVGGPSGGHFRFRDMLTPCFIGTFVALALFYFEVPLPGAIQKLLNMTSAVTIPMSMIVIGITIGSEDLKAAFSDRRVYLVCLIRLVLSPILVWLILKPLTADPVLLRTAVVLAGCPTGVIVPIISLQYDHDASFASNCVVATTLLALITVPAMLFIMG